MNNTGKQLSSPFSTGGGGVHFEAHIQASFVVLMLTEGYAPCLPCFPIKEVKLQGKINGYDTDDLIVVVEDDSSKETSSLLGQVKHSIQFTKGSKLLGEVINAAWSDFNNPSLFRKGKDKIALITGPLNKTDFHNVVWLLEQARCTKDKYEFFRNVKQLKFSPSKAEEKLNVFLHHLERANNNPISDDVLYAFLNDFFLLGYDLGSEVGVVLSLLHSHIAQFNSAYPKWAWSRIIDIVQTWNQNAGTVTREKLPEDLIDAFKSRKASIPDGYAVPKTPRVFSDQSQENALTIATIVGKWDENNENDLLIIRRLTDGF